MSYGRATLAALLALGILSGETGQEPPDAEFHFLRVEYRDNSSSRRRFGGWNRGWWRQDWPEADVHFTQGIRRLTRIDTGDGRHLPLTDDRIFEYPWIYATQTGYWDLSKAETDRLGEFLRRGGFLVVDDFYGQDDWDRFAASMERTLPGEPILELEPDHPMMHVLYDINERTQIPGLRHLRRGGDGGVVVIQQGTGPHWRSIEDGHGRMVVAINFQMDVGDAWEHADLAEYPEPMTGLAYRLGINYIIYSMTH